MNLESIDTWQSWIAVKTCTKRKKMKWNEMNVSKTVFLCDHGPSACKHICYKHLSTSCTTQWLKPLINDGKNSTGGESIFTYDVPLTPYARTYGYSGRLPDAICQNLWLFMTSPRCHMPEPKAYGYSRCLPDAICQNLWLFMMSPRCHETEKGQHSSEFDPSGSPTSKPWDLHPGLQSHTLG